MVSISKHLGKDFAVEVSNIKIGSEVTEDDIIEIKSLWSQYKLIIFRDQEITETDLVSFSRYLGDLEIHVRTEYLSPENPEILYVSNVKENGRPIGILSDNEVGWHYDQIYLPKPAVGSLLAAYLLPPDGGNTQFSDMTSAYKSLPEEVKRKISGRTATQSYEAFNKAFSVPTSEEQKKKSPDIEQPLVRTHPITGEKALYLCPGMTTQISDMDPGESREMLDYLFEWSVRPEFVYDHQWKSGDCVLWDNACTMHRRGAFDSSEQRWMKRTTILAPEELAIPF